MVYEETNRERTVLVGLVQINKKSVILLRFEARKKLYVFSERTSRGHGILSKINSKETVESTREMHSYCEAWTYQQKLITSFLYLNIEEPLTDRFQH